MAKATRKSPSETSGTLSVATWNINSVRLRIEAVRRFLAKWQPDVLCLQETKVHDPDFPTAGFIEAGYPHIAIRGEKSYNGVAIISRVPIDGMRFERWAGKSDYRHLTVDLPGGIELHNFYVPAGGDIPDIEANTKFAHKLEFLRHMIDWFAARRDGAAKRILVGDLNVAPLETDVWSHKALLKVVSHTPIEVELMNGLMASHDWVDAVRHFVPPAEKLYTWWSYRSPDWSAADKGRRLDHVWVTPPLKPHLKSVEVVREIRGWETASDHAPVIVTMRTPR
jgi:exodeoxyribonuclease-3